MEKASWHHGSVQEEQAAQVMPFLPTQRGDKVNLNEATHTKQCKTPPFHPPVTARSLHWDSGSLLPK